MNSGQKVIVAASGLILICILLFPPWQQAANQRVDYRKDIGRGFVLHPPQPVAVDCYFVGCKTAMPSDFHVLLYSRLLFDQCASVLFVALIGLWMLRTRRDGTRLTLTSRQARLKLSMSIALLVPPLGSFPLASMLLDIPKQIIHRDELWLVPMIFTIFLYGICVGVIYLFLSLALQITGGGRKPVQAE